MEKTYEKLQRLMESYVPEFSYKRDGRDPGSVLSDLCGSMIDESAARYAQAVSKHRIQYLNLFDSMIREPVSAAKGYIQFQPVTGYEGRIPVPKRTQVIAPEEEGDIVFETSHDMTVSDTEPELIAVTDRELDRIIVHEYDGTPFHAFDVKGKNRSEHRLYLGFDRLFEWLGSLDVYLLIQAASEAGQQELLDILCSPQVQWSMLNSDGTETVIKAVEKTDTMIHLMIPDYIPERTSIGNREGFYLCVSSRKELPKLYIGKLRAGFFREQIIPEKVFVNGVEEASGGFFPFGKPLGLYQEFSFDNREALSRRGAKLKLDFHLSYRIHEELLEVPELDTEYKPIMKKPRKPLAVRPADVKADYVIWEYRSTFGWKRLFTEEYQSTMFNGSSEGEVSLEFICPEDMAEYEEGSGRIRARLLRAENIYHMPAVYQCPFFSGLMLSYSYMEELQAASYAVTKNNFEEKDVTESLKSGGNVLPFYHTEHRQRTMYIGFPSSMAGTPFGLYFDIENYSGRPVDFRVEYLSDRGFAPVRIEDHTEGFCGSGNILFMIPADVIKHSLFGYNGYFIRFVDNNKENPEYALPLIRGIYPNMARIINVNTVTEEFYLDDREAAVEIQMNQQNLLRLSVQVQEKTADGYEWVSWKKAERMYEGGRTYQADMAEGILRFRKNTFVNYELKEQGPHIRVEHSNYTGAKANLPERSITVLGTAIRYISSVSNPFPTYGGYDGYTEQTNMSYVSGLLRTRNRAVTRRDFYDLIMQSAHGIRKIKCCDHMDAFGNEQQDKVTIAVLIGEYEKGAHVFSEVKKTIRDRILENSALLAMGKELTLIQPHFVRLSVRVWLEKDSMEQAYDTQHRAEELIRSFIDPMEGGQGFRGWEIGEFPRASQIVACLRNGISDCSISRIVMTALVDGKEILVTDDFCEQMKNPFLMAVNGEHIVYIEVRGC